MELDPESRCASVTLDTRVYRLAAIKKAAYKFSGHCVVDIAVSGQNQVTLTLSCARNPGSPEDLLREIHCEITDQEMREVILDETAGVRNLLLAQAFSATSLIDAEGENADYLDDPRGISAPDMPI